MKAPGAASIPAAALSQSSRCFPRGAGWGFGAGSSAFGGGGALRASVASRGKGGCASIDWIGSEAAVASPACCGLPAARTAQALPPRRRLRRGAISGMLKGGNRRPAGLLAFFDAALAPLLQSDSAARQAEARPPSGLLWQPL